MASVRDNGTTNNDDITTIFQQKFNVFGGKKNEIEWSCDKWSGYKRPCFHSYFIILSLVIMDPVRRLQLAQLLLQLDNQQNDIVQHQHQQVIRPRKQRRHRRWWCKPWLLRRPALGQFEHLMVELVVEDPAGFQNFVRCEPAMFQEMVERLTPIINKQDTNYCKALDPEFKVTMTLRYIAIGDTSKSLQYGFRVAYNTICLLIAEVCAAIVEVYHEEVIQTPTTPEDWRSSQSTIAGSGSTITVLGQSMVNMWPSGSLWMVAHTTTTTRTSTRSSSSPL